VQPTVTARARAAGGRDAELGIGIEKTIAGLLGSRCSLACNIGLGTLSILVDFHVL
jgi:hypothetical protein